ncbi:n19m, NADH-ubiquinone oxidoreductase 9.5 kDa subunit [Malassezia yamatoensis]|uniref:N19m, NADH-ubiquinone oxidoreductase 9.5 kDa subunit n=1 Tax=Malassezia yamatoensis TaxID=253288 RepID=A0AAJ5YV09_9BASI|nr:n19m, NADH-ubiquinone oxidoreductase 9.5 kDa subunit [Malassezia yamatoensis]
MSFLSSAFRPLGNTLHYLVGGNEMLITFQRAAAHEKPTVFFALVVGFVGPVAVLTVPRIRASYGWKPAERIPISYPLPEGPRKSVSGYDDE